MQIIVVVKDQSSDHPIRHHLLPKAGDVLHYQIDERNWGVEELRNPDWRILDVPGLTEAEAQALISPEVLPPNAHEFIARSRGMRLDLKRLGLRYANYDRGGVDAQIDVGTLRAAMTIKDPVPHPDVIGPVDSHTIG